jgi:hypothetical protein
MKKIRPESLPRQDEDKKAARAKLYKEVLTLILSVTTLLWITDVIKVPEPQMKPEPNLIFRADEQNKLIIECYQSFYNAGKGTGKIMFCEARLFPATDDEQLAHYTAYHYTSNAMRYSASVIVVPQDAQPVSGLFDYEQQSMRRIHWEPGNYRLELGYQYVKKTYWFFGESMVIVKNVFRFSLDAAEANRLNNMISSSQKKNVVVKLM